MYDLTGLGARIRQLRIQKGFTQEGFARELGISAQAVSKWETGVGCPDIGMLPLIANVLETTIDSLFSEPEPLAEPIAELEPVEPVPGELSPTCREIEEEKPDVREVFSAFNLVCLSDMTPERIDGLTVCFPDGSSADLGTRTIVNYGGGIIKIQENAQKKQPHATNISPVFEEEIVKQVESALQESQIDGLENLGDLISEQIHRALQKKSATFVPDFHQDSKSELTWNGTDIDSLDLSVSGSAQVSVHNGTPGQWSVIARGQREFLDSLRCIEDGNVLKIESLPYRAQNFFSRHMKNTIDICTGFAQGVELDVKVRGSGKFTCEPAFQSSRVSISGSGDVEMGDAGNFICSVSGSGDITFVSAKNAVLTVSGSGDIQGGRVEGVSELKISGSGDAELGAASGQLSCRVSGSGDVELGETDLEYLSVLVSGSGDISAGTGKADRLELTLHGAGSFDGEQITAGELTADLNGPSEAVVGRLLGKSVERVSRVSKLRILQRG